MWTQEGAGTQPRGSKFPGAVGGAQPGALQLPGTSGGPQLSLGGSAARCEWRDTIVSKRLAASRR
jgi:hypothetical protein